MRKNYLCSFPNLGLELKLSPNYRVQNHGYYESVLDHFEDICIPGVFEPIHEHLDGFQSKLKIYRERFGEPLGGMCEFLDLVKDKVYFIFCQQNVRHSLLNKFIEGHEEMHAFIKAFLYQSSATDDAIWMGGALKETRERFPKLAENFIPMIEKNEFETLADAGGLIACLNQGYSLEKAYRTVVRRKAHPLVKARTKRAVNLI